MHTMDNPRNLDPNQPSTTATVIPNAWTAMITRRWTTLWLPRLATSGHRSHLAILSRTHEWRLVRCLRLGLDERTITRYELDNPISLLYDMVLRQVLENKARGRGGRRTPRASKCDTVTATTTTDTTDATEEPR